MELKNLTRVFEEFDKMKILIIGDVMIDSYLWGEVSRISPEAPVPILSKTTHESRLGGAGNVALNIQALGAEPVLCSIIGNDPKSELLHLLMSEHHMSAEGIIRSPQRITTVKTRIISQNHHLLRVDEEDASPIQEDLENELIARILKLLDQTEIHAIIFEDYDKGVITPKVIQSIVSQSIKRHIPTLVDPKKRNFNHYKGVTFFKPNFKEFREGLKQEMDKRDQEAITLAAKQYLMESGNQLLMITLAEHGVCICDSQQSYFFPAHIRNISDVSGAGDTVISVSALCLATGISPANVAQIANMAGGLVCEKPGVVPIDKQRLLEECMAKLRNDPS